MRVTEYQDWPFLGERSMAPIMKDLKRAGKSWMTSHDDWIRSSGIRGGDRAVFEHRNISKALETATCYDQLNMPNVAAMEVLLKRRMLIEQAYSVNPDAPDYGGSEHFMGFKETTKGTFIHQGQVGYQAQKMKEETNILREQRLKRAELQAAAKAKGKNRNTPPNPELLLDENG